VSFHYGKALLQIANVYPSLFEAVLEAVQNSIDSGATKVGIAINRKDRTIDIVDNGTGVSRESFAIALRNVCNSEKERGKLGQYGIGLISSLGKCKSFTFTSQAQDGDEGYLEWTFDTARIAEQDEAVEIPVALRPLYFCQSEGIRVPRGLRGVTWRTRLRIIGYVEDRRISDIKSANALKEAILDKYGIAMRRNDVSVRIKITNENGSEDSASGKAKLFSGKRLPEVILENTDAGKTFFRLYLARKGTFGYQGKILVGVADDDYRFSMSLFMKDAADLLPDAVIELFKSGVFEGEILTTKGKLHVSRKKLEQNDAYVGFCTAIEEWFLEHGKKHLKEVREERQGQRIQDLSVRNLQNIQLLLANFDQLRQETIGSFKHGTVGSGHRDPDDRKVVGVQDESSVSVTATSAQDRAEGSGEGHANDPPERENQNHTPFTVAGPKGRQRQEVKGGSQGLQFAHLAMRPEGALSVLVPKDGTIFFNVEHPEWVAAAKAGDRELMQLQEIGAIMALIRYTMPKDYENIVDLLYTEVLPPLSFLLRNSPSFNLSARLKATTKKTKE